MKEVPLSTCERKFIASAAKNDKRIDGRHGYDIRSFQIQFGIKRGSCQVLLGRTRVLAQVSCEITSAKVSRPTEGILHVNLELSPMAAPQYEAGRLSAYGVELNRLLERCLCESRCIDLESLCIVSGEKVWTIRLDIHILDDDGSLIDCASIAAITALSHFRVPAFTVLGEDVVIFPPEEKEPVPLTIYWMPICSTFAFFEKGNTMVLDPNNREQRVSDGKMILAMTAHREICTLHLSGKILFKKQQVLTCVNIVSKKVGEISAQIKRALQEDAEARLSGKVVGFSHLENTNSILEHYRDEVDIELSTEAAAAEEDAPSDQTEFKIIKKGPGTVQTAGDGPCTWDVSDDSSEMEVNEVKKQQQPTVIVKKPQSKIETIDLSEDSEEEEVIILNPEGSTDKKSEGKSRGWYKTDW